MTIAMDEDSFSNSLSNLSTLSSSGNYNTLISGNGGGGALSRESNGGSSTFASNNNSPLTNGIANTNPTTNGLSAQNSCDLPNSPDNSPYVVFVFRSNGTNNYANNSLELYEERKISLGRPCKIGRAVAKIRPEPNNAIFDCKVLSRNHALIWEENGKVINF
jgi:hypothetical protein